MIRLRLTAVLVAMIGVAAACGGSSSEEAGDGSDDNGGDATSLSAFFGFDPNDPDASAARQRRLDMRIEELLAGCMANQGFEYVPAVRPIDEATFAFDEEEYARELGFGITTTDYSTRADDGWVNPNEAIVKELSPSESEAYDAALYGDDSTANDGSEPDASDIALFGEGCRGDANREVFGSMDEVFNELNPLLEDMYSRMDSDPRMVEATEEWKSCMADRGYAYQTTDELWREGVSDISNRYYELIGDRNPFAGWSEDELNAFASQSDAAIEDFYQEFQMESSQNVDQDALAALKQEELDLAVANYECGTSQREAREEVSEEIESQFIADHREVLEQARDSFDLG